MSLARARALIVCFMLVALLTLAGTAGFAAQAAEACDGLDNDADGLVDEDFPSLGQPCLSGINACEVEGKYICRADGLDVECDGIPLPPGQEGPAGEPSCSDFLDNDCDGFFDFSDPQCTSPEVCDGFDNDNDGSTDEDFPDLGSSCTAGVGSCRTTGVRVCGPEGDGTTCTAMPGVPTREGPSGSSSCTDGSDNDCDGVTDLKDPSCQTDEICDGLDNNGNDQVDETFSGLGLPCIAGAGACQVSGTQVCDSSGDRVVCSALPLAPHHEGPDGQTCRDETDNDCDSLTDAADPDCASVGLAASCGFDVLRGSQGNDFNALYRLTAKALPGQLPARLGATRLLLLDSGQELVQTVPVAPGQEVRIKIRDRVKVNREAQTLIVEAPNVLAETVASDGRITSHGYCSPYPLVKVMSPDGLSIPRSAMESLAFLDIRIATARVVPDSVHVYVDGVDLLKMLGVELSAGPHDGSLILHGNELIISDLDFDPDSSSLTFRIAGLGGGGHVIAIEAKGEPIPEDSFRNPRYQYSAIRDSGVVAVLAVDVQSPAPNSNLPLAPVVVTGQVTHGLPIEAASIQGIAVDTSTQVKVAGDGFFSADTYSLPFAVTVPISNLTQEFATATITVSSFNPGANIAVARASDAGDIVAFARRLFSTGQVSLGGPVASTAPDTAASAMASAVQQIPNAFIGMLDEQAINVILQKPCEIARSQLVGLMNRVTSNYPIIRRCLLTPDKPCLGLLPNECPDITILGVPNLCVEAPLEVDMGICSPDLQVRLTRHTLREEDVTCTADAKPGQLDVTLTIPQFDVEGTITGGCCASHLCLGFCCAGISVDADVRGCISPSTVVAQVSPDNLLHGGTIHIVIPPGGAPTSKGKLLESRSDVTGVLGGILDFADFANPFGNPIGDLIVEMSSLATETLLRQNLGDVLPTNLPAIDIGQFGDFLAVDTQAPDAGIDFQASPSTAVINDDGIRVSYQAQVSATAPDPNLPALPVAVLRFEPAPDPPVNGDTVLLAAVSDNIVNQSFAALTAAGKLRSVSTLGSALGDLGMQGYLANPQFAEAGVQSSSQALLFAGIVVPPRLLLTDDPGTPRQVELQVRANDVTLTTVVDRSGDGVQGALTSIPACLSWEGLAADDCIILELCVDLNLLGIAELINSGGPTLSFNVTQLQQLARPAGLACFAERNPDSTDEEAVLASSADNPVLESLRESMNQAIPRLMAANFDFGGFVKAEDPILTTVETDGQSGMQEYLGVTSGIATAEAPPPPVEFRASCGCTEGCDAPIGSASFDYPAGTFASAPGLTGFLLDYWMENQDNELEHLSVRVEQTGGQVTFRDQALNGEEDQFYYSVAAKALPPGTVYRTISGSSSGGSAIEFVPDEPGVVVLTGFSLSFTNGDHNIDEVGVMYRDLPLLPRFFLIAFNDENDDDPFTYEVRYARVPTSLVADTGTLHGDDDAGTAVVNAPGDGALIQGFSMDFFARFFGTPTEGVDHHIDRIGVEFGTGPNARLSVNYNDKNGDDHFHWQVEWVRMK